MWLLLCKQAFRYIVIKIFPLHTAEPCLSRALSNYRQSPILQWFNFLQCVFFIPWEMCSTSISAVLPSACFVNSEAKNSFLYIYNFLSVPTSAVNKLPLPSLRGPSVFLADLLDYVLLKNVFLFIFIISCNLPFILHLCFSYHFCTLSTSSCNLSIPSCIWYCTARAPPLIILSLLVRANWAF